MYIELAGESSPKKRSTYVRLANVSGGETNCLVLLKLSFLFLHKFANGDCLAPPGPLEGPARECRVAKGSYLSIFVLANFTKKKQ